MDNLYGIKIDIEKEFYKQDKSMVKTVVDLFENKNLVVVNLDRFGRIKTRVLDFGSKVYFREIRKYKNNVDYALSYSIIEIKIK